MEPRLQSFWAESRRPWSWHRPWKTMAVAFWPTWARKTFRWAVASAGTASSLGTSRPWRSSAHWHVDVQSWTLRRLAVRNPLVNHATSSNGISVWRGTISISVRASIRRSLMRWSCTITHQLICCITMKLQSVCCSSDSNMLKGVFSQKNTAPPHWVWRSGATFHPLIWKTMVPKQHGNTMGTPFSEQYYS